MIYNQTYTRYTTEGKRQLKLIKLNGLINGAKHLVLHSLTVQQAFSQPKRKCNALRLKYFAEARSDGYEYMSC